MTNRVRPAGRDRRPAPWSFWSARHGLLFYRPQFRDRREARCVIRPFCFPRCLSEHRLCAGILHKNEPKIRMVGYYEFITPAHTRPSWRTGNPAPVQPFQIRRRKMCSQTSNSRQHPIRPTASRLRPSSWPRTTTFRKSGPGRAADEARPRRG